MLKKFEKCFIITLIFLLAVVVLMSAVLLEKVARYDKNNIEMNNYLHKIEIIGSYSEEGGAWKPLTPYVDFSNKELRNITVNGYFTEDIPKGSKIFIKMIHMRVTLSQNGKVIFNCIPAEGDKNPTRALGRQWGILVSPGISKTDNIEINFGNLYQNDEEKQFTYLLWNMYTGDHTMLIFEALKENVWEFGIGMFFLILTFFLFIASLLCIILRIKNSYRLLTLGIATLFSAAWFLTQMPALTLFIRFPVFLDVLYAFSIQGIVVSLGFFSASYVSGWRKSGMLLLEGALLLLLFADITMQMKGVLDLYDATDHFVLLDIITAIYLILCLIYEYRATKSSDIINFLKSVLPLVVLGILEIVNGYLQFFEAAICFGLGLLSFYILAGYYIMRRIRQSFDLENQVLILENELTRNRLSMMVGQIQPHFLYNSLVGIKQLCDTEPKKASDALEHFSYYLRGNLDSLSDTRLISFDDEIKHLKDYLYLEKMRFPQKVNLEWNIEYSNFELPSLILQPIVENAVRHGISKKNNGGIIRIQSRQLDDSVLITVTDDGVGFDTTEKKKTDAVI